MNAFALSSLALVLVAAADLPPLTRAEAEACTRDRDAVVVQNQALGARSQHLQRESDAIEQAERGLERLSAQLDADRAALIDQKARMDAAPTLDEHLRRKAAFDAASASYEIKVASYNQQVREQQARREPYNRAAIQLNAELAALDAQAKAVDARCAGRPVQR